MASILTKRDDLKADQDRKPLIHLFGKDKHIICDTEQRGYALPRNRSPLEHFVNVTEGYVPLWEPGQTLRWRFQERSLLYFADPDAIKGEVRRLLGLALEKWEEAAPIGFAEHDDAWDFEISVKSLKNCNPKGCVLASAFFPDPGRHEFVIYPSLFEQSPKEQLDTFIHETGHIFGLRHWFADVTERAWPFVKFGEHKRFTIMNYGTDSDLTMSDKRDLILLYQSAWSGELADINGTPIRLVQPYHLARYQGERMAAAPLLQPSAYVRKMAEFAAEDAAQG